VTLPQAFLGEFFVKVLFFHPADKSLRMGMLIIENGWIHPNEPG